MVTSIVRILTFLYCCVFFTDINWAQELRRCDEFSGETAGEQLVACIKDLPAAGGTADARNLLGGQVSNVDPFESVKKPVKLLLGAITLSLQAPWNLNQGSEIAGISPSETILTVNGNYNGINLASDTKVSQLTLRGTNDGRHTMSQGINSGNAANV